MPRASTARPRHRPTRHQRVPRPASVPRWALAALIATTACSDRGSSADRIARGRDRDTAAQARDRAAAARQERAAPLEVRCGAPAAGALLEAQIVLGAGAPIRCAIDAAGHLALVVAGAPGTAVMIDAHPAASDAAGAATVDLDLRAWLAATPTAQVGPLAPDERPPPPARPRLPPLERPVTVTPPGGAATELRLQVSDVDVGRAARWIVDEAAAGRAVPGTGGGGVLYVQTLVTAPDDVRRVGALATAGDARLYARAVELARTPPRTCRYRGAGASEVEVAVVGITERVTVHDHAGRQVASHEVGPRTRGCPEFVEVPTSPPALILPDPAAIAAWLRALPG